MDKKSVTYPKEEKIQLPLGVVLKVLLSFLSSVLTDKQILFAKQAFEFQDHCVIEFYAQYCRNCGSFVSRRLDRSVLELCDKQVVSTIILTINSVT